MVTNDTGSNSWVILYVLQPSCCMVTNDTGSNSWVILYVLQPSCCMVTNDNLVIEFSFHVDLQLVMVLIKEFVAQSVSEGWVIPWM